jgi:DNA mismatch repair protein MSH6
MILDGHTLLNLEILENSHENSSKGTLLEFLDHCNTPFGKRMLRKWLLRLKKKNLTKKKNFSSQDL